MFWICAVIAQKICGWTKNGWQKKRLSRRRIMKRRNICFFTKRNFHGNLSNQTEIRLYLPFSDWVWTTNEHCPFAMPNQSENGKYNLISVWFNKIPREKISLYVWEKKNKYGGIFFFRKQKKNNEAGRNWNSAQETPISIVTWFMMHKYA